MKNLKIFFRNLSFRKKIIVVSVIVGLIPTTIIGTFSYYNLSSLLIEKERTSLNQSLGNELISLKNKLFNLENSLNYITFNSELSNKLNQKYTSNYDIYILYRDYINPIFSSICYNNDQIENIVIYTDNNIHPRNGVLEPLSSLSENSWYYDVLETSMPFWVISEKDNTILLVSELYAVKSEFNTFVCMSINYDKFFKSLSNLFDTTYGITITDKNNTKLYEYKTDDFQFTSDDLFTNLKTNNLNSDYVIQYLPLSEYNWNAYIYKTKELITASTFQIKLTAMFGILFCIFLILVFSTSLSRIIVKPLELLSKNMNNIENGDLSINVITKYDDEIGKLIKSFNSMVKKLNYLINEVYKSKIAQQKYEMEALQAQINPHFLYNSLSLINSKAILCEQEDISQMSLLLSTFYRTTLNKGKNITSVKDELENIRSYCSIQSLLHSNSFEINYRIDETAYKYEMINLLLQPLVENSIIHGINHITDDRRGKLDISCSLDIDGIIFAISDNGCGIDKNKLSTLLNHNSNSYGVQNVNKRIKLYYGENYGLNYVSQLNIGTTVTFKIPFIT